MARAFGCANLIGAKDALYDLMHLLQGMIESQPKPKGCWFKSGHRD